MLLGKKSELGSYQPEISQLYKSYLHEQEPSGMTYFGIISESALQAFGGIICYMGYWYLRGCVVKPEFRGNGFQRELIVERLDYLSKVKNAKDVRVSVSPTNLHSIENIKSTGFIFVKNKVLKPSLESVSIYKKVL